jgi:hypothetical protein
MGNKIDYQAEGTLFLKLKESGEKLTHAAFCQRRSEELGKPLSLAYFRKILHKLKRKGKPSQKAKKQKKPANATKKEMGKPSTKEKVNPDSPHDWSKFKVEFMKGEHKTLSALARAYGIDPVNKIFRNNTKGWLKERREVSAETAKKTVENLIKDRAADNARDMYAEILLNQWLLMDVLNDAAAARKDWKPLKSPHTCREAANFVIDMQKAFEQIMPNLQGLEKMNEIRTIFDGLSDGNMDIAEAAIELVKLGVTMPEPLKMMLQKHQPEEVVPDDGDEITEEQILAKRQEMLAEIEVERTEFVTERKREVVLIKEELAHVESFGEDGDGPEKKV